MTITSWIANLSITGKFILGISFGLFIWVGLRLLIHYANDGYKEAIKGKRKQTQLEVLKELAKG